MPISASTTLASPAGPVTSRERIQALDVLRGFALLGVVVVNSTYASGATDGPNPNAVADWVLWNVIDGRFYTLFAFLFGLGFALHLARSESRGANVAPVYVRRLLVLFGIGALHVLLAYKGDILMSYAIVGLFLLPLRHLSTRGLLGVVAVLLLLPILLRSTVLPALGITPPAPFDNELAAQITATGGFADVAVLRVEQWTDWLVRWWWFVLPDNLMLFVLGLYVGRSGIFQNLPARLPFVRKILLIGLVAVGLGFAIRYLYVTGITPPQGGSFWHSLGHRLTSFMQLWPQVLVYASGLVLLCYRPPWSWRLDPLAAAGRMALSNYLLASITFSLLYSGYGLGLYSRVGLSVALLVGAAFFALEIALSHWWMARFQFGPAEWLWRSLTYGTMQPMRLRRADPAVVLET